MMWLKIEFNEDDTVNWLSKPTNISVSFSYSIAAPVQSSFNTFRLSPIFPLVENFNKETFDETHIHFYNFANSYRALGRLDKKGSDKLKVSIFFSLGLSSVILVTKDQNILEEFNKVVDAKETAYEIWKIKDSKIIDKDYRINNDDNEKGVLFSISNYEELPLTERALIDEFSITISLLMPKLQMHMPGELDKILRLIDEVNVLIEELNFLHKPNGVVPESISEYTLEELQGSKLNQVIQHQNIDRIIQINSALSYISTQAFSGAIPILERRSLIRRNSLLGIGSGILALNNIARFIETSFSRIPFDKLITNSMSIAKPLKGLDDLPQYDPKNWNRGTIDDLVKEESADIPYYKLPYFSGRLGFRETEFSIAAAIQSISSAASLEWSLMTLTHEMLHGHVRNIISSLFYGKDGENPDVLRNGFYKCFDKRINKAPGDENLGDSIRNIILTYCCHTTTHGSIAEKRAGGPFKIVLPPENELWNTLEDEYRNISEIFVHILDLHYFYAGRVSLYIPLIWCSWVAVPHINGDIRQYVLRSLLAISSKEEGDAFHRFNISISRFKDLLSKYKDDKLNYPIIFEILNILDDINKLNEAYFPAFKASLIIVDLVTTIFVSGKIRSYLFNDEFVKWKDNETDEESFEQEFEYDLPSGFNDEIVTSPLSYLLDRMKKELYSNELMPDLERESTLQFLALNSST